MRDELGTGITQAHDVTAAATRADAIVIATGWDAYRKLDWTDIARRMRSPIIFDGRQVVSADHLPRRDDAARNGSAYRKGQRMTVTIGIQNADIGACPSLRGRSDVIFTETKLKGSFIVDAERREDDRGFFARIFCQKEFMELGLESNVRTGEHGLERQARHAQGHAFPIPAGHRGEAGAVLARRSSRRDRGLAA